MYLPAKTITDCFAAQQVGLDVALEALREAWAERKVTMDDLPLRRGQPRMTRVMRPYLEALTA